MAGPNPVMHCICHEAQKLSLKNETLRGRGALTYPA